MKLLEKVILGAGLVMLLALVRSMDASAVCALVAKVGWGFALILPQEIIAHVLNAWAWRFSYSREHARAFSFYELLRLRIAGDGVNYLTPSATIAGEFARASLLNESLPLLIRSTGVLVAKCAQALAQVLFVLMGFVLFVRGKAPLLKAYENLFGMTALLVAAGFSGTLLFFLAKRKKTLQETSGDAAQARGIKAMAGHLLRYFSRYPARCAWAVALFFLAFAWGGFEVFWICRFIALPVSIATAMAVEVLSCMIDSLCVLVPAKIGTQEAGKTAVFALLGLPARSGLAFGIVRHVRELAWAAWGLLLYSADLKRNLVLEGNGQKELARS